MVHVHIAGEHCCCLFWRCLSLQALESLDFETLRQQASGTRMLCLQLEACSSFWPLRSWQVLIAEFVDGDVCVQCAQLCFSAAISETGIKDQRNFQISNSPVSGGCFRKACPSPGMYPRFCFLTWGTDLLLYAKPYTLRLHNCNSGLNLAPGRLGFPVVPFCPFYLGVSLLKPNIRKKGTLIIKGLLGNLDVELDPLNPKPQIL